MKLKRQYYVPGMISLIFLLPLTIAFFSIKEVFTKYYMKEVSWMTEESMKIDSIKYSGRDPYPMYSIHQIKKAIKRKYIAIPLNGDDESNKKKLLIASELIDKLKKERDTINGMHLKFYPQTKYWAIVYALDILEVKKHQNYFWLGDDLWIYLFPKRKESVLTPICGGGFYAVSCIPLKQEQKSDKYIKENSTRLKIVFLIFLLLVICSLFYIRSFPRKKSISA
jgi:hypothetical protein